MTAGCKHLVPAPACWEQVQAPDASQGGRQEGEETSKGEKVLARGGKGRALQIACHCQGQGKNSTTPGLWKVSGFSHP